MDISYGEVIQGRHAIAEYIISRKSTNRFTVIDVGGAATGWSVHIADAFVDINPTPKLHFKVDICRHDSWNIILDYVNQHGKFDYSICTHTLEDIYNPYLVLDNLPRISRAGIISMPSVHTELNYIENTNWLGFAHHRYLFGHKNNTMIIAPKLPILERLSNRATLHEVEEIRFHWTHSIPYSMLMNNYLGPNTTTVIDNYENFIREQTSCMKQ